MSKWIDADALMNQWCDEMCKPKPSCEEDCAIYDYVRLAPSIDIVRCAECKWGKPYSDKQLECDALGLGGLKFPDDYCSYGEREGE